MDTLQPETNAELNNEFPYQNRTIEILENIGTFEQGHFVYTSGRHGEWYIRKDDLYAHPVETDELCSYIAQQFIEDDIQTVIGPALGGIGISHATALHLSRLTTNQVFSVYAEKTTEVEFEITRGYDKFVTGKRVLVVEDNLTTGGSVLRVVNAVRQVGGYVVGVGVVCNRGNVQCTSIGNPDKFISLAHIPLQSWDPSDCPFCKADIPINTNVGKGKSFLRVTQQK